MGFRKGADVDEELWPTEAFGGVSDEQFWDDMASDKPLTTTARTAQQDPGTRNRLLAAVPPAATQPAQNMPAQNMPAQNMPAQNMPAQNMPAQNMPAQTAGATQPVRAAAGTSRPVGAASRPVGAAAELTEARARRRTSSSADEDPLTSAAFSLRTSGPVDGRSSRRSPLPYSGTSYGEPSSVTQAMSTPPYGENYGYDSRGLAAEADDPRRQNGTRSPARHAAEGTRAARQAQPQDGYQATGSYPTGSYPTGSYPNASYPSASYPSGGYPNASYPNASYPTGGYPVGSYPPGSYPTGGYPAGSQDSGYQGSGHRAPYDPRDDYRRLTHRR